LIRLDGRRVGRYTQTVPTVLLLPADFNISKELAKPYRKKEEK
jgi:hypothetical protein